VAEVGFVVPANGLNALSKMESTDVYNSRKILAVVLLFEFKIANVWVAIIFYCTPFQHAKMELRQLSVFYNAVNLV
jgi:hypothetical protein